MINDSQIGKYMRRIEKNEEMLILNLNNNKL